MKQLQSTYAIALAATMIKVIEKAGNEVKPGDELTYWVPMSFLERAAGSEINVNAQDQEGEQGAFISLKLPTAETDGQEKT